MNEYLEWLFSTNPVIQTLLCSSSLCPEYPKLIKQLERMRDRNRFDQDTFQFLTTFPASEVSQIIKEKYEDITSGIEPLEAHNYTYKTILNTNTNHQAVITYRECESCIYTEDFIIKNKDPYQDIRVKIIAYHQTDGHGFTSTQAKALFTTSKNVVKKLTTEYLDSIDETLLQLELKINESEYAYIWQAPQNLLF